MSDTDETQDADSVFVGGTPLPRTRPEGLVTAAENGNVTRMQQILNDPIHAFVNKDGCTALHQAAVKGHVAAVEFLLSHGADPNRYNTWGETVLHYACKNPEELAPSTLAAIAKKLLQHPTTDIEAKVKPNSMFFGGETSLALALLNMHHYEIALLLLEHGASANNICSDQDATALHYTFKHLYGGISASKMKQLKAFVNKLLLRKDVDVNKKDGDGRTALMYVCRLIPDEIQMLAIMEKLLKNGAKTNITDKRGDTVLHTLTEGGPRKYSGGEGRNNASKAIGTLLQNSPDRNRLINTTNKDGATALLVSIRRKATACTLCLLDQQGLDINRRYHKETVLHAACTVPSDGPAEKEEQFKVIQKMVEKGADLNARDAERNTPLHLACGYQKSKIAEYLMGQRNIELQPLNQQGLTPLMMAAKGKSSELDCLFRLVTHTPGMISLASLQEQLQEEIDNGRNSNKRSFFEAFAQYDTDLGGGNEADDDNNAENGNEDNDAEENDDEE